MKKQLTYLIFFLVSIAAFPSYAQTNSRFKTIFEATDSLQLDSLSLIPGSVDLLDINGNDANNYIKRIDHVSSWVYFNAPTNEFNFPLKLSYRVFPYQFGTNYYHKSTAMILPDIGAFHSPSLLNAKNGGNSPFQGLERSGSISRGLGFGNNQDVVLNSSLNLQLSGKIAKDTYIQASITDNSLPAQADGYTQQLQEFDRVYIKINKGNSEFIAGDINIVNPETYFLKFFKKGSGLAFKTQITSPKKTVDIESAVALSRGKFARNIINGQEGNQGPYRLTGNENESFIIILSGTEQVFIDGQLLKRGIENDYIIDYNTAEITFTPNRLITKDRRIVVQFQYSDQNYARSLLYGSTKLSKEKWSIQLNAYSEQDAKNQSLQQEINSSDREILSAIGDNLQQALVPSYEEVGFLPDAILYRQTDTLSFGNVFVFSTDPNNAVWRVSFSNVGENNGNYIEDNQNTNGKIFKWVAPEDGVPQGSFEPVRLLITPKRKQMFSVNSNYQINDKTTIEINSALSNNDQNLFSDQDSNDDYGYALHSVIKQSRQLGLWELEYGLDMEWIHKSFSPIERYRPVEFERNKNLSAVSASNQQLIGANWYMKHKNASEIHYRYEFLDYADYASNMHLLETQLKKNNYRLLSNTSILNSNDSNAQSFFLKNTASLDKQIRKHRIGISNLTEHNVFENPETGITLANSYAFYENSIFLSGLDTTKTGITISYTLRNDLKTFSETLQDASRAHQYKFQSRWLSKKGSDLRVTLQYRELEVINDPAINDERTILARLQYRRKFWKGAISSQSSYQTGSGLEPTLEFSYLKVNIGQGTHIWQDRNENGIQELDEFELALFPGEAEYIRVFTPSTKYQQIFNNQFSQSFTINPAQHWSNKDGIKGLLSHFMNQMSYQSTRKTSLEDYFTVFNPFDNGEDNILITEQTTFRNSLFFNRSNSKYGGAYNYQNNANQTLLSYGTEIRTLRQHELQWRYQLSDRFRFDSKDSYGQLQNDSEAFENRSFLLDQYLFEQKVSFQANQHLSTALIGSYTYKINNEESGEILNSSKLGMELQYNKANAASVLLQFNFIDHRYQANSDNTAVAYEMLQGLKEGANTTWMASIRKSLTGSLQLSINYNGRKSEDINTIHTATVQIKAFF